VKCCDDKEHIEIVGLETPIVDGPYTNSDQIAIQMTENPLHNVKSIKING
jgi:hypothetical protein